MVSVTIVGIIAVGVILGMFVRTFRVRRIVQIGTTTLREAIVILTQGNQGVGRVIIQQVPITMVMTTLSTAVLTVVSTITTIAATKFMFLNAGKSRVNLG